MRETAEMRAAPHFADYETPMEATACAAHMEV